MEKTGVCPVRSGEILNFALNALRENEALDSLPEEPLLKEAEAVHVLLPDHYLPDIYLDLPLTGGTFCGKPLFFSLHFTIAEMAKKAYIISDY